MTRRDEIIRMAREAGFVLSDNATDEAVSRFGALIDVARRSERDRCALIAIAARDGYAERNNLMACAADYIACAIRALKEGVSE